MPGATSEVRIFIELLCTANHPRVSRFLQLLQEQFRQFLLRPGIGRIVCEVAEGTALTTGQRFGMIRFGSRLDVYLPDGAQPLVAVGQTMVAGETVLADLSSSEPARTGVAR